MCYLQEREVKIGEGGRMKMKTRGESWSSKKMDKVQGNELKFCDVWKKSLILLMKKKLRFILKMKNKYMIFNKKQLTDHPFYGKWAFVGMIIPEINHFAINIGHVRFYYKCYVGKLWSWWFNFDCNTLIDWLKKLLYFV